ncbi:MAG: crossover junction endodeoxyribonuclease RuvC [Acidobacteria bacterium]|nr:crossover junction endodeoxyribonuclease RuvC [Acidobacteriota bacterium]
MRIFGIDPGSVRTGYGCVESDGTRHRLVACGAVSPPLASTLPERLRVIHDGLRELLRAHAPDCVAIETLFHARNVRSALVLGQARGVAVLAVIEAGLRPYEYAPAEIKVAVTGYGRAEKTQMQQMVKLLLGLEVPPAPHDAADALAVALCHAQSAGSAHATPARVPRHLRSWRHAQLPAGARRQAP